MRYMIAAALLAVPTPALADQAKDYAKLTVQRFVDKLQVRDDDLETHITISTQAGYNKGFTSGGFLFGVTSGLWLAAKIDKQTREVTYLIGVRAAWIGDYQNFTRVTFTTPNGPKATDVLPGNLSISTCITLGCDRTIDTAVVSSAEDIQSLADGTEPRRFRFRSTAGGEFENSLPPVEAQALLLAVAKYR